MLSAPQFTRFLSLLILAIEVRAEAPALLLQAMKTQDADRDRWAYTSTTQRYDRDDRPIGGPTIEHYDPSRPYDLQWELHRYQGRIPSDSDVHAWRRQKLKELKRTDHDGFRHLLDLNSAVLAEETPAACTYRVPFLKNPSQPIPTENLQALLTIDKASQVLTSFSVRPRNSFRVAVALEVDQGAVDGRLATVAPKYAPALVYMKWSGSGTFLGFFHVGAAAESSYTQFRRVSPYNGRFAVNIGRLKAIDF